MIPLSPGRNWNSNLSIVVEYLILSKYLDNLRLGRRRGYIHGDDSDNFNWIFLFLASHLLIIFWLGHKFNQVYDWFRVEWQPKIIFYATCDIACSAWTMAQVFECFLEIVFFQVQGFFSVIDMQAWMYRAIRINLAGCCTIPAFYDSKLMTFFL